MKLPACQIMKMPRTQSQLTANKVVALFADAPSSPSRRQTVLAFDEAQDALLSPTIPGTYLT